MPQANFVELAGVASQSSIERGAAPSRSPPSGAPGVFSFSSLDNGTGAVALAITQAATNPTAKGVQVSAALQHGVSAGPANCSLFVFAALSNLNVSGVAYMLGLADGNPQHIVLRKGDLASGLPDIPPGTQGVLCRATTVVTPQTWLHLMLEAVLNGNGDVVVNAYQNDLTAHTVAFPVWTLIPGMSFTDDPIGVNSGSVPLAAGYLGFGFQSSDVARVGLVAGFSVSRQN